MQQRAVGSHDDRRQGWIFWLNWWNGLGFWLRGLVICEDLVDAEGHVGEEEGRFDGIAAASEDAPRAEDDDASYRCTDEEGIGRVEGGKGGYAPNEVKGA